MSYTADDEARTLRFADPQSFDELVHRYHGKMLSVASRILGNPEDGRDCVQDAFLQAFKNIGKFEGRSSVRTWLHRIVANTALLKLRWRRRRPEGSLDEIDKHQSGNAPLAVTRESAETIVSEKETRAAVHAAIERLPEDYRKVVLLRDIEEVDTHETATMLQITPGAVRTRLHRARAALRALLDPFVIVT